MIKQPILGQQLAELRKRNGLTQEDLVEKCNVSVRTIQRIESGEVTPRSSTVDILLAALEYDREEWSALEDRDKDSSETSISDALSSVFLMRTSPEYVKQPLKIAWMAGIVSIVFTVLYTGLIIILEVDKELGSLLYVKVVLIILSLVFLIGYLVVLRGFLSVGLLFDNYLLKLAVYLLSIYYFVFTILSSILLLFFEGNTAVELAFFIPTIMFGGGCQVVLGIALLRLQDGMGKLARVTGIMEIITGSMFASVLFVLFGLIMIFPTMILEIILLYKSSELIKEGKI